MNFKELFFIIQNKPYFEVNVLAHHRVIQKFIQVASSAEKGEEFFLIAKNLKGAWFKPFNPIINGLKFVCYVDINNAIPLDIKTETKYISTDYVMKEIVIETITEDTEKQKINYKTGLPEKFVTIDYPPSLLYEMVEAFFVEQTIAPPKGKYDGFSKIIFWVVLLVAGYFVINTLMGGNLLPF